MKAFIVKHQKAIAGTLAILLVGGITMSFQDTPFSYNRLSPQQNHAQVPVQKDTLPDKDRNGSMTMKEFDELQKKLDKTLVETMEEVKKIDLSKIQKEVEASLKSVDLDQIMKDVERSLKSIDVEKILADVTSSLKDINWDEKNEEVEKAMKEAKKELEKARLELKEIDKEAIKKEMDKAKEEIKKSRVEIEKIDMDKIMSEAREGIDKAKTELREIKAMFNEMEKDGLIDQKEGFTIEYKNKDLYINGKKQSAQTTDKYRKYFKDDHFRMKIDKE